MNKLYFFALIIWVTAALQFSEGRGPRIKKVINMRSNNAYVEYTYMTSGYVETMYNAHGFTTTYAYTDSLITRQLSNQSEVDTYLVNKQGLVRQSVGFMSSKFKYEYNADGFMVRSEAYVHDLSTGTNDWVIANGNIQSVVYNDVGNQPQSRTQYIYYTDKANTIGNTNLGLGFLGRSSKNLIKESINLSPKGDTIAHLVYKYHFDKLDRVTQKVVYTTTGQLQDSTSYVYFY